MKALQLHYTSCRHGQSGNPGFQVRASTPGIEADERQEIERRGVYRPPRSLPSEPTAEQVAAEFPRAFRVYPLQSGRRAVTFASYTGRDYSGRWGNFFAHTLVLEVGDGGAKLDHWPIDYYEWRGWRQGLQEDEDEGAPPALPTVDLSSVPPASSFDLSELRAFLGEEEGRSAMLARMGQALLLSQEDSRPLVIQAEALDGLYWVACLQKLFPPWHAWELGFSTYQDDPRGAARINATVPGSDFTFGEAERRYQFYMFDPENGVESPLPESRSEYPALAVRWLAESPSTLKAFFSSLGRFQRLPLEGEILHAAADLFRLGRGELCQVDGHHLAELLQFAHQWATREGRIALVEELGRSLLHDLDPSGLTGIEPLRFLAEVADTTGQPEHRRLAFGLWLHWLESGLAGSKEERARLKAGWHTLLEMLRDYREELIRELLDPERLPRLRRVAGTLPARFWLLVTIRESLEMMDRTPFWLQPEVRSVLKDILTTEPLETAAGEVLAQVPGGELAAACSEILARVISPAGTERERLFGQALAHRLEREPQSVAIAVRRRLHESDHWQVLLGEGLALLERASDPARTYEAYNRDVLEALPGYRDRVRDVLTRHLLECLEPEAGARQAVSWILSGEMTKLDREMQEHCIRLANRSLSLDPADQGSRNLAETLAASAKDLGVSLEPDLPFLRGLMDSSGRGSPLHGVPRERLVRALEGIEEAPYRHFLKAVLLPSLEATNNYSQHRDLLVATYQSTLHQVFAEVYSGFLKTKRTGTHPGALQSAVRYWLCFFDRASQDDAPMARLEGRVRKILLRTLTRLPNKTWAELCRRLANLSQPAAGRWLRIEEEVRQRRRGVVKRLFDGLSWLRGVGRRSSS